jgi:hypothetical protein
MQTWENSDQLKSEVNNSILFCISIITMNKHNAQHCKFSVYSAVRQAVHWLTFCFCCGPRTDRAPSYYILHDTYFSFLKMLRNNI